MTFRIYGRQFAPVDYSSAFVDGAHWTDRAQAQSLCDDMNKHSEVYVHSVVEDKLIENAWQEAECWFAENGIKACTVDEFDVKHMEFIDTYIALKALEAIGS